jgi:hypothetical protein
MSGQLKGKSKRRPRKLGIQQYLYQYQQFTTNLAFRKWQAWGMPPACSRQTRHNSGNCYGDSPGHGTHTCLSNKSHISVHYRLQVSYISCTGYNIHLSYVSISDSYYVTRSDNRPDNHFGICSLHSKIIFITPFYIDNFIVKIWYMIDYKNYYVKSDVGSVIGKYSYMAIIASYRLQRMLVAKGGDQKYGN